MQHAEVTIRPKVRFRELGLVRHLVDNFTDVCLVGGFREPAFLI